MDRSVFLVQILAHVADINAKLAGVKGHLGKVTGETLGCIRSPIYIAQQTIQEIEQLIGEIGTLADDAIDIQGSKGKCFAELVSQNYKGGMGKPEAFEVARRDDPDGHEDFMRRLNLSAEIDIDYNRD